MSKPIYVMVWTDKDGVADVDGYWNRPLTLAEQHAHFKKNYPNSYDPYGDGSRCDIEWELVCLKGKKSLPGLPRNQWCPGE